MERVAFLIEETNEVLSCLLNPENLLIQRTAGIRSRRSATGQLTSTGLTDDPLLYTGGGRTELNLALLFDVTLAGSSITTNNVRDLTGPLWDLAENTREADEYGRPRLVRFIWGKAWNIPAVVVAVAERLEYFTPEGVARRSWLRMRLLRVDQAAAAARTADGFTTPTSTLALEELDIPGSTVDTHEVTGGATGPEAGEATVVAISALPADLSASGLIGLVMKETGAGAILTSARTAISSAATAIAAEAAALYAAEEGEEEKQEEVASIGAAVNTIFEGLGMLGAAVETEIVGAVTTATVQISAAASRVAAAVDGMASAARRPIVERIQTALAQINPALDSMAEVAGMVASVVKRRASAVIAASVHGLASAGDAVRTTLDRIAIDGENLATAAADTIRSGVDRVGDLLADIRSTGETVATAMFPAALEDIAQGVDRLWRAGQPVAARTVTAAVEAMSMALKRLKASAEAMAAVSRTRAAEIVASNLERIQAAVEAKTEPEAHLDVTAIRAGLGDIAAVLRTMPGTAEAASLAPVPEALAAIRSAVDESPGEADRVQQIQAGLQVIGSAVEEMTSREATVIREMIESALTVQEEAETSPPVGAAGIPEPAREAAPAAGAMHLGFGERLDQVAFAYYRNPALWRLLASFNNIDHPLRLAAGSLLRVPPASAVRRS